MLRCARLESLTKMELAVPTTPSLQPQIDPESGKLTFPDSREYGEFLDSEARFDWNKRFERRSESEFSLRSREFLKLAHKDNENVSAEGETEGDISMFEDEENMKRAGRDRRRLSELDVDHDKLAKIEKEDEWISASSDERLERQLNREKEGQVYVMERKPSVGMPKEGELFMTLLACKQFSQCISAELDTWNGQKYIINLLMLTVKSGINYKT